MTYEIIWTISPNRWTEKYANYDVASRKKNSKENQKIIILDEYESNLIFVIKKKEKL